MKVKHKKINNRFIFSDLCPFILICLSRIGFVLFIVEYNFFLISIYFIYETFLFKDVKKLETEI